MSASQITKEIIVSYINNKTKFSEQELIDTIIENGGTNTVGIGISIDQYLEMFERDGIIRYDIERKEYFVNDV